MFTCPEVEAFWIQHYIPAHPTVSFEDVHHVDSDQDIVHPDEFDLWLDITQRRLNRMKA
jgi:hypothetical protein